MHATPDSHDQPIDTSRRTMMRQLLGAAAGAAVAAVALDGGEVSAQTGAMQYGTSNNSGVDTTSLFATVPDGRTLSSTNYGANGYAYGGEATTVYGGYGSSYGINMTAGDTGIVVFGQQQGVHSQASQKLSGGQRSPLDPSQSSLAPGLSAQTNVQKPSPQTAASHAPSIGGPQFVLG